MACSGAQRVESAAPRCWVCSCSQIRGRVCRSPEKGARPGGCEKALVANNIRIRRAVDRIGKAETWIPGSRRGTVTFQCLDAYVGPGVTLTGCAPIGLVHLSAMFAVGEMSVVHQVFERSRRKFRTERLK